MEDARSIKSYLDQAHEMVTSLLQKQQDPPPATPEAVQPQMTRLTAAAQLRSSDWVKAADQPAAKIMEITLEENEHPGKGRYIEEFEDRRRIGSS